LIGEGTRQSVESFNDWSLDINPCSETFGAIIKRAFGFIPLTSLATRFDALKTALSLKTESVDGLIEELSKKQESYKFELLEESENSIYILINIPYMGEKSVKDLIINLLRSVGGQIESNYCKYFVNNCFIVDKLEAFGGDKVSEETTRNELRDYINANIELKPKEKTEIEKYSDSFAFRPFFGEALQKLPKYTKENDHWDWDELYINPGLDSEKFVTST